MPTASCKLWPSKKESDGKCPVYLVLQHRGDRAVIALPIRLSPADWNPKAGEVRRTNRLHRKINDYLEERRRAGEDALTLAIIEGHSQPVKYAKRALADGGSAGFVAYAREMQKSYSDRGKWGTVEVVSAAADKFESFAGDVRVGEVTPALVRRWCDWMARERGNRPNTVSKSKSMMGTVWLQARREGLAP